MPFIQLTMDIGATDPAPYEAALTELGALSITLQDAADNPVLEPAPGTTPLWPSVRLSALFDGETDAAWLKQAVREAFPELPLTLEELADRAWEREWLKDFKPMSFGRRLWVCPGEQAPPETDSADDAPMVIVKLDPGLAFGTGTHPTTALCLEWLDGAQLQGKRIIDFGCGSGVLAIAALKLGAAHAIGIDIDPQALIATRDNAARNDVTELEVQLAEQLPSAPADVLLANILAEPLDQLAPTLAHLVRPGGHIVLSGVLESQAEAVAARYAPWFDIAPITTRNEWARIDGVRRSPG